jgi:N-acetylmuramoyl-L-alanine amidase
MPTAVSQKALEILVRTLWGEARGEGFDGQVAVAWTIRNRVEDNKTKSWWGEGYDGVCQKRWQFSCWNANDPNFLYLSGAKPIPAAQYAQCLKAALLVVNGQVPDPTSGATHYYATTMPKPPTWIAKATLTLHLGAHRFYKNVP